MVGNSNDSVRLEGYVAEAEIMKPQLFRRAKIKYNLSLEDAEDIYQSAILELTQRNMDTYDHNRKFAPWFARVFTNRYVDYIRKVRGRNGEKARVISLSVFEKLDNVEVLGYEAPKDEDFVDEISISVDELSPRQREVIRMHYWEGMEYNDIADKLKIARGTTSRHADKAKRKLRKVLNERGFRRAA